MTPYFVKERIENGKPVKLASIENGKQTHIILLYPNGYIQSLSYTDFLNRLSTAQALSDNPVLEDIKKDLDAAVAFPIMSIGD